MVRDLSVAAFHGIKRHANLVLDEQPDNLDVMMSLASVYEEQGREEEALQLVEYGELRIL